MSADSRVARNQAPPLVGHDVVASDAALVDAVRSHAPDGVLETLTDLGREAGTEEAREHGRLANVHHPELVTVDRYGNTASTTHTVALVEDLEAGRIEPGETVALIALASGLEIGIVLVTLDDELVGRYGHGH